MFRHEAQMEALQKAKDKTLALLSESAKDVLAQIYGSLDDYLETMIEAQVRVQKQDAPATLGVPLEAIEGVKESPDVTSVAAATAAATATAVVQSAIPQAPPAQAPNGPQGGWGGPGSINSRPRRPHPPVGQRAANVTAVMPPCRFRPARGHFCLRQIPRRLGFWRGAACQGHPAFLQPRVS